MAKETKRQHYVPRTYLKNFSTERKSEFYINSLPIDNCVEDAIYETNVTNVCLQNGIYTLPGETEEQRLLIEKFYSDNYEVHYNGIYNILTDANKKNITEAERELIISTVVTMFYRTTKWINQHNTFFNRVLESAYNLAEQNGFDYFMLEKEKISIAGKTLEQIQKEFKYESRPSQIITQLEVALNLIKLRMVGDSIMVVKLIDENVEFITSDNPVVYSNPLGQSLAPFDAKNILKLPLDSKHLLLLMPSEDSPETKLTIVRSERRGRMSESQKLTSNYCQFTNADKFILGSNSALKSYLATKEVTERPLTKQEDEKYKKFDAELSAKLKELGII
jgi:hypothetical protein